MTKYTNSTPAQTYQLAASGNAGDTITRQFRGEEGRRYGFNRLVVGATNLNSILVTAVINSEITLLKDVHLSAIRHLFLHRSLLSPFIIEANRTLEITLKNTSNAPQRANIEMTGMSEPFLSDWLNKQTREGREILQPSFMYGFAELVPLQVGKIVPFTRKTQDVQFNRLALGCNTANEYDITAKLYRWNDLLKNDLFLPQFNDEFLSMNALVPYEVSSNIPIELHFDNLSAANTYTVSIIAEGYHV